MEEGEPFAPVVKRGKRIGEQEEKRERKGHEVSLDEGEQKGEEETGRNLIKLWKVSAN